MSHPKHCDGYIQTSFLMIAHGKKEYLDIGDHGNLGLNNDALMSCYNDLE